MSVQRYSWDSDDGWEFDSLGEYVKASDYFRLERELALAKARAIPDGWVAVPEARDECPECHGEGTVEDSILISWTTLKTIHARVVGLCARPQQPGESNVE